MDGFKARLRQSVQFQLSFWLSISLTLAALAGAGFSFFSAFDEAHELQDDTLRQVGAMFRQIPVPPARPATRGANDEDDEVPKVRVQTLSTPPSPLAGGGALALAPDLPDGLRTQVVDGERYRVSITTLPSGARLAVSQSESLRDVTAFNSALRTALPFFVLLPLLVWAQRRVVRRIFRPVVESARDIDARGDRDLRAVPSADLAQEVRPFAAAINRLLGRVSRSMQEQQLFVADAAHELRSPLTALSLQAERLAAADMSPLARDRLAELRGGIERSRKLVDQLLSLARLRTAGRSGSDAVSVRQTFKALLEDRMPLIEARGLDAGVVGDQDLMLAVPQLELDLVIGNLLDNAIRNAAPKGRVDLEIVTDGATGARLLRVEDDGPGIAPQERERVFDPFYRIPGSEGTGSGLGLSIVKEIADRWNARVVLEWTNPEESRGLRVVVELPRAICLDTLPGPAAGRDDRDSAT